MTGRSPRTLLDYLRLAAGHLSTKGIESARLDAELLLADVLGCTRVELYTSYDRPLEAREVDALRERLRRRAAREPVAYILGRREFFSLDFEVDRRVLVPRPETELLVERTIALLQRAGNGNGAAHHVLDLGTGSGAIAVSVAHTLPDIRVMATDIAAAALEVAPRNADRHGVADRIEFRAGDLFDAVGEGRVFSLIVSNPPYIAESEIKALEPEVREWEPAVALVSGPDGMDATRRIIEGAPRFLDPDGFLLLEVGTQVEEVRRQFLGARWRQVRVHADLAGIPRVVEAQRPEG